jgi:hypothetical protein
VVSTSFDLIRYTWAVEGNDPEQPTLPAKHVAALARAFRAALYDDDIKFEQALGLPARWKCSFRLEECRFAAKAYPAASNRARVTALHKALLRYRSAGFEIDRRAGGPMLSGERNYLFRILCARRGHVPSKSTLRAWMRL